MAQAPESKSSAEDAFNVMRTDALRVLAGALGIQHEVSGARKIHMDFLVMALRDHSSVGERYFSTRGLDRDELVAVIEREGRPLPPERSYKPAPMKGLPRLTKHVTRALEEAVRLASARGESSGEDQKVSPLDLLNGALAVKECSTIRALDDAEERANRTGSEGDGTITDPSPAGGGVAALHADRPSPTAKDALNVEAEARAFARLAASKRTRPPLSIGVFGEWGSGKSFFMEKMHHHVGKLQKETRARSLPPEQVAFHEDVVQISFNAWHYVETNLWASLVDHIFRELDEWLQREPGKDEDGEEKIEALYKRLSTSRMLTLEALTQLMATKRREHAAEKKLKKARSALAQAEARSFSISDLASAVAEALNEDGRKDAIEEQVTEAAKKIGLNNLATSAGELTNAMEEARDSARRGRLVLRSVGAQFLQDRLRLGIILVLLVSAPVWIPALVGFVLGSVGNFEWAGFAEVMTTLTAMATTVTTVVTKATVQANSAVDRIAAFQAELEATRERRVKDGLASFELDVVKCLSDVESAKARLDASIAEVDAAQSEFADSAAARLNRFIRDKVADGEYAKHLGIISSIRRDFETLADIMSGPPTGKSLERAHIDETTEYRARLKQLVDEAAKDKLLSDDEIEELRAPDRDDGELRFFQRIVLYIDDLDRCPPEVVVKVLQACHLLLSFPLFIVVVAVDARWVSKSLLEAYPNLLDAEGAAGENADAESTVADGSATPRDYLEKIFQIPYWVRHMRDQQSQDFVSILLEREPRLREVGLGNGDAAPGTEHADVGSADDADDAGVAEEAQGESEADSGERDEQADGQTEADEELDLNPASLQLKEAEERWLEDVGPFAGDSPRAIKRFVNVYRLLRTGLDDVDVHRLVGPDGNSLVYRAIITQLAIVTGAPTLADDYFKEIGPVRDDPDDRTPETIRIRLAARKGVEDSPEWAFLDGALAALAKVANTPEMTQELRAQAHLVKRYSFSARPGL